MAWFLSLAESRFLVLYWVLVGLAVLVAAAGPVLLPAPRPPARVRDDDLGPYELALLAGGPRAVVDSALDGLVSAGAARITDRGRVIPGGSPPRDRIQRYVLSRICHNRRLTGGRNALGLCHHRAGRALIRRLLSLGYLARRRAGWRLRWVLVGVMALGVLQVMAEHGVLPVVNTAVVPAILLTWGLGLLWGCNAVEVRWPQGMAIASRRQLRWSPVSSWG